MIQITFATAGISTHTGAPPTTYRNAGARRGPRPTQTRSANPWDLHEVIQLCLNNSNYQQQDINFLEALTSTGQQRCSGEGNDDGSNDGSGDDRNDDRNEGSSAGSSSNSSSTQLNPRRGSGSEGNNDGSDDGSGEGSGEGRSDGRSERRQQRQQQQQ